MDVILYVVVVHTKYMYCRLIYSYCRKNLPEYIGTNDLVTQRDNKLKSILFGTGKRT